MQITSEQIQKIKEYLETQPVNLAYLFGSQAIGKTHNNSDVDVAILFDKTIDENQYFDKKLELMSAIGRLSMPDKVDIVPLNKASLIMRYDILKYGMLLINKSQEDHFHFRYQTLREYLHNRYYLNLYTVISLASIAEAGLSRYAR